MDSSRIDLQCYFPTESESIAISVESIPLQPGRVSVSCQQNETSIFDCNINETIVFCSSGLAGVICNLKGTCMYMYIATSLSQSNIHSYGIMCRS